MVNDITKKNSAGLTLVELLVVISIIAVISAIVFANYREGEKQFALQRSAHKLAQDIRRAQNMAMAARGIGGVVPRGYGIHLITTSPTQYILFADNNGNGLRDAGDTDVETLGLETGNSITGLSPASPLTIVFFPPDPTVLISGSPANTLASISLNYAGGAGRTVSVNRAGLIE